LLIGSAALLALALLMAFPTSSRAQEGARWPDWMPNAPLNQINKGDDAGGTSLLLEPDIEAIISVVARDFRSAVRRALREQKIRYQGLQVEARRLSVVVADKDVRDSAMVLIDRAAAQWKLRPSGPGVWTAAEAAADGRISVRVNEAVLPELRQMALAFQLDRLPRLLKCLGHERFSVSREGERIRVIVADPKRMTFTRPGPCADI
jgi:preprotein translocase subunit SecD